MKTICQAMVESGIAVSNYYSDLYVPVNNITREILNRPEYSIERNNATIFFNQVEKCSYYDIPFAFDAFWDKIF